MRQSNPHTSRATPAHRITDRVAAVRTSVLLVTLAFGLLLGNARPAVACGGFFCQSVPINQAAEQIVFRQQGDRVTAMVRILYEGDAEAFSWVVPVPKGPTISLGADQTFVELDALTRPRFFLEQTGNACQVDFTDAANAPTSAEADNADGQGLVSVNQSLTLGPFDIEVVASDNPDAMAQWLQDNNYDLTDRGRDLIEPYVLAGMEFVALKLRSGESSGSIQPLILEYASEKPMVPLRLTAVAALEDMGVQVWVVADARAVPENFEHVIPNYTQLDWYTGGNNAYASYQNLITRAMNETDGGKGFATDFAGRIDAGITSNLTNASVADNRLANLDAVVRDADFISASLIEFQNPSALIDSLQSTLPLADNLTSSIYYDASELNARYTPEQLGAARAAVREVISTRIVEPLRNSVALLPDGAYMTRLYTTLSADEMTVDPVFSYNQEMPDQALDRHALLNASCGDNGTEWTLTLGKGTGRDGEKVIAANQPIPFGVVPVAVNDQVAAFERQRTSADAAPETLSRARYATLEIAADGSRTDDDNDEDSSGFLGSFGPASLLLVLGGAALRRRRIS